MWVRWKGTTVGTVEGMGNVDGHSVHVEGGVPGYGEMELVQSRGEEGRYT